MSSNFFFTKLSKEFRKKDLQAKLKEAEVEGKEERESTKEEEEEEKDSRLIMYKFLNRRIFGF